MSQSKIFIRTIFYALPVALLLSSAALAQPNTSATAAPLGTTVATPPAGSSGFSGYSSGNTGAAPLDGPQPVLPAPDSLPMYSGQQGGYGSAPAAPVIDPAAAAQQNATQQPQAAAAPAVAPPPDPCAAYMASYESYVVCQDRMLKIQRMKDAKAKRTAPATPATPTTPAVAPAPVDPAAAAAAAAVTAIQNANAPKQQKGVSFYK